jgi:hypothetical protein
VADRAGLRGDPAAAHGRVDVVRAEERDLLERLTDHHARRRAREVIVIQAIVDRDPAIAGGEPDAGDGRLPATSGVGLLHRRS